MQQPSEKDVEAAKEYIRRRLDAERSMVYNLEKAMKRAAEKIVEICYSANISPQNFHYSDLSIRDQNKVDEVIKELQEEVGDYYETLAIADHEEDRYYLLPIICGEDRGLTFEERLEDYCNKYKNELMLLIGAGLFLGVAKKLLAKSIGENLKHPYANQLLAEGIDAPLTYGRGKTNSMFTAIGNLTRFGIAKGWMKSWERSTSKNGCFGWIVRRGSSWPCDICNDNCGFHSIEEGTGLPVHNHCCCVAIPVYV